jgi:hypothetical protein
MVQLLTKPKLIGEEVWVHGVLLCTFSSLTMSSIKSISSALLPLRAPDLQK